MAPTARVPRNSRLLGALPFLALVLHQVKFLAGKGRNVVLETDPKYLDASKSSQHRAPLPRLRLDSHQRAEQQRTATSTGSSNTSSSSHWWDDHVEQVAMPFRPWNGPKYSWCLEEEEKHVLEGETETPAISGLVFMNPYKTLSSAKVMALNRNMARQVGKRHLFHKDDDPSQNRTATLKLRTPKQQQEQQRQQNCEIRLWRPEFRPPDRHGIRQPPSLLWTVVSDPAKRVESNLKLLHPCSKVYLPATATTTTDDEKIHYCQEATAAKKNALVQQLRIVSPQSTRNERKRSLFSDDLFHSPELLNQLLRQQIFQSYDFVAVMERWEESVAVMKLLFALEVEDIILLSPPAPSSSWGDWNHQERNHHHHHYHSSQPRPQPTDCTNLPPSTTTSSSATPQNQRRRQQQQRQFSTSPVVEHFEQSNFTMHNADFLLYAAANRSLDLTIDALGRDRVSEHVLLHRQLQQLVDRNCKSYTTFPCGSSTSSFRTNETSLQPPATAAANDDETASLSPDCTWWNRECGYQCTDRVLSQHK
jgi:hypothetical protein